MARSLFAGTTADFAYRTHLAGTDQLMALAAYAPLTVWNAATGGTQLTDLLDVNSVALTALITDVDGQIPAFYGPDSVTRVWIDSGAGDRELIMPQGMPGPTGPPGPGGSDSGVAGYVNDTTPSATRTALIALFPQRSNNGSDFADPGTTRANIHVPMLASCQAVATANLTLSGTQTVDGYAAVAGDQILCTGQTTGSQNGPWVVAAGAWTRPTDYASAAVVKGRTIQVNGGSTYGGTVWAMLTSTSVTIDTTAATWQQVNRAANDIRYAPNLPAIGSLTYDTAGNVLTDSLGVVYTYNADNTVHTITFGGVTRTLTYNTDGTIASVA